MSIEEMITRITPDTDYNPRLEILYANLEDDGWTWMITVRNKLAYRDNPLPRYTGKTLREALEAAVKEKS